MDEAHENVRMARRLFTAELERSGYQGVMGVAGFRRVYRELMPVQQTKLREMCRGRVQTFLKEGFILCLGVAFPESAIDCIDAKYADGSIDRRTWNRYATEYRKLNDVLNTMAVYLAEQLHGTPIPATVEGIAGKIRRVDEYYGMTVSHRVIAEQAGVGWRGKNELIVHDAFSCALRFAAVFTTLPLVEGKKVVNGCGGCKACLDACPLLRNKESLEQFREGCRKYIMRLQLDADVCGKCIKACYNKDKVK
jgi:epoxyqueuosine reductase QueG